MRKYLITPVFFLLLSATFIVCAGDANAAKKAPVPPPAEKYDVRILRDSWGVPHVFGKTDADAAFGLAYAQCEDDFATIQDQVLTLRARRAQEYGAKEFLQYKFDMAYAKDSWVAECVNMILAAPPSEDPVVNEALEVLRTWNLRTDPANTGAAIGALTIDPYLRTRLKGLEQPELMKRFSEVAHDLKQAHGRIDVAWQEVNRLHRGNLDLGLGGGPDILRAAWGGRLEDGRIVRNGGDSYVLIVEWDEDGNVSSQSIHQYGSATSHSDSPHYSDQAYLFNKCLLKPVWYDEADIRAHLEREYRPGEEIKSIPAKRLRRPHRP